MNSIFGRGLMRGSYRAPDRAFSSDASSEIRMHRTRHGALACFQSYQASTIELKPETRTLGTLASCSELQATFSGDWTSATVVHFKDVARDRGGAGDGYGRDGANRGLLSVGSAVLNESSLNQRQALFFKLARCSVGAAPT